MSYAPSDNGGGSAMLLDIDGTAIVSSDITMHQADMFNSDRHIYFIDSRNFITLYQATGLLVWNRWLTAQELGGTFRCTPISSLTGMTDESYCGANVINSTMQRITGTIGGANILSDNTFNSIWRIK